MMIYRIATVFTILFMTVFGSASAIVARTEPELPTCAAGTGPIHCCESTQSTTAGLSPNLIVAIILALGSVVPQIGLTCSPILSIAQANACTGQTVCCTNNNFNGLVNLGCSPITINL